MRCNALTGRFLWLIGPMVMLTLILLTSVNIAALRDHAVSLKLIRFDIVVLTLVAVALAINYILENFWTKLLAVIWAAVQFVFSAKPFNWLAQKMCCKKAVNQGDLLVATREELQPLPVRATHYNGEATEPIALPMHIHPAGVNFHKIYPQLSVNSDGELCTVERSSHADQRVAIEMLVIRSP